MARAETPALLPHGSASACELRRSYLPWRMGPRKQGFEGCIGVWDELLGRVTVMFVEWLGG